MSEVANEKLGITIGQVYPGSFYKITVDQWVIVADKLTKEIADSLNITGGGQGRAVVFKIETYFGWHDKALWEWLDLKTKK